MKKKTSLLIEYLAIPLIISILICFVYMFLNIYHQTPRSKTNKEYTDSFWGGQIYCQEMTIDDTSKIKIDVLPTCDNTNSDIGINYEIKLGEKVSSGFIPLDSLDNHNWTTIDIPTGNALYSGTAVLTLESVKMDGKNYVEFLVVNNLDNNVLSLTKDGTAIEGVQLSYSYLSCHTEMLVVVFLLSFAISFALWLLMRNKSVGVSKYPVAYISIIFFAILLLYRYPYLSDINMHVSAQYYFSYQNLGFVNRSLLGTVIELLGINLTVERYITWGIFVNAVLVVVQICFIYHKRNAEIRKKLEKCYLLFVCTPFCISSLFGYHFFARLDQLLMIAFVLSCMIIISGKGYVMVPIISIVAILIHEMYVTIFIPFVFVLILIKWYAKRNVKNIALLIVNSVISVSLFILVSFVLKPSKTFDEAFAYTQVNSEPLLSNFTYPMKIDFFSSTQYKIQEGANVVFRVGTIPLAALSFIIALPLLALAFIWLKEYVKTKSDRLGKLIVLICPLTSGGMLLTMATMCDWGRLFVMYGFGVCFTLMCLMNVDKDDVSASMFTTCSYFKSKFGDKVFYIIGIFYLILSTIGGASSTTLFSIFERVISSLQS